MEATRRRQDRLNAGVEECDGRRVLDLSLSVSDRAQCASPCVHAHGV